MTKVDQTDEIWKELRLVVFVYACLTAGYAVFLYLVYGQEPSQEWPELLKGLADIFFAKKANILATAIYVVLTTLPLAISAFFVMVTIRRKGSDGGWIIIFAIILPFIVYFTLIDRSAVSQVFDAVFECHSVFENGRFSQRCNQSNWQVLLVLLIWGILKFYFIKYKFPLTIGSIILGSWAGYRIEKQLGKP
jgi:hypothetical protein